jgi:hypothetical protein
MTALRVESRTLSCGAGTFDFGRFDPFAMSSGKDRFLRETDGWCRREPIIADRVDGGHIWGKRTFGSATSSSQTCVEAEHHQMFAPMNSDYFCDGSVATAPFGDRTAL